MPLYRSSISLRVFSVGIAIALVSNLGCGKADPFPSPERPDDPASEYSVR